VVEQPVSVYLINLVSDVGILLCVYEIFKYKKTFKNQQQYIVNLQLSPTTISHAVYYWQ